MEEEIIKNCNSFAKEVVEYYFDEIDIREEKSRQIRLAKEEAEKRKRQKETILIAIWYVPILILLFITLYKVKTMFSI